MKVDTLFLSGCGSKIGGYVGVFTALLEKKIIDLDKIKRYVCCSAGAIVSFNLFHVCFIDPCFSSLSPLNHNDPTTSPTTTNKTQCIFFILILFNLL